MRPRLIAVDDRVQSAIEGKTLIASMRPRLIAVDDFENMEQGEFFELMLQ